jgi:predicted NAD/FAD-dependent oxidoreductase
MSSLVRPLADGVRVNAGRRVQALERRGAAWHVWFDDETSVGPFHAVAVAAPPSQAGLLLGRFEKLAAPLSRVRMLPCWALMVGLESRILGDQDIISDLSQVVRWLARNNSKPGRNTAGDCLVVHASSDWSREAEALDSGTVAEELWSEVSHLLSLPPIRPSHMTAHLWREGRVDEPLGEACLYSPEHNAGIAGDWCLGSFAEDAFASGDHLGRAIAKSLA